MNERQQLEELIKMLYPLTKKILELAPEEGDGPEEDEDMYAEIANLKCSIEDSSFGDIID